MQRYCNRIKVSAYVTQETFERIEKIRQEMKGTQSGVIASVLDEVFGGDYNDNVQS